MDIEEILNDVVPLEHLKKAEEVYNKQKNANELTKEAEFQYACCLVRSKYPADVRKGLNIFEEMYKKYDGDEDDQKRDYVYYLALGNARVKEYTKSLHFVEAFLKVEPNNKQVKDLEGVVRKRLKKEGLEGIAVAGAVGIAVGGLVTLGFALAKKRHQNDKKTNQ